MNDELVMELVKRIQQLERRVEYLETETAEKNTFSTVTVEGDSTLRSLIFDAGAETISSGAITPDATRVVVTSESGTADNLDTINGTTNGQLIILHPASGHTITVRDVGVGSGNIQLVGGGTFDLDSTHDSLVLIDVGAYLVEISRANVT